MWTYKCDRADAPTEYNGKPIFTQENFDYSKAEIGDYVEQAVVDDAMDCLPPASMSAGALRWVSRTPTGRTRRPGDSVPPTTRSSVWPERGPNGIWQFCGCCFQGETVPRGRDPIYC